MVLAPPNGRRAQGKAIVLAAQPAAAAATLRNVTSELDHAMRQPAGASARPHYHHGNSWRDDMLLAKAVVEQFAVRESIGHPLILTVGSVASGVHGRLVGELVGSASDLVERVIAVLGTLRGAGLVQQLASASESLEAHASIAIEHTPFAWCGPLLAPASTPQPPTTAGKRARADEPASSSALAKSHGVALMSIFKQAKRKPTDASVAKKTHPSQPKPSAVPSKPPHVATALGGCERGAAEERAEETTSAPRRADFTGSPLAHAPSRKAKRAARPPLGCAARAGPSYGSEGCTSPFEASGAAPQHVVLAARRVLDPAFEAEQGREDELQFAPAVLAFEPAPAPRATKPRARGRTRGAGASAGVGADACSGASDLGLGSQGSSAHAACFPPTRVATADAPGGADDDDFDLFSQLLAVSAITGESLAHELMLDAESRPTTDDPHSQPSPLASPSLPAGVDEPAHAPHECTARGSPLVCLSVPLAVASAGEGSARCGLPLAIPFAAASGEGLLLPPPRPPPPLPGLVITPSAPWMRRGLDAGNIVKGGFRRFAGGGSRGGGSCADVAPSEGDAVATAIITSVLPFRFPPAPARTP